MQLMFFSTVWKESDGSLKEIHETYENFPLTFGKYAKTIYWLCRGPTWHSGSFTTITKFRH